VTAAVVRTATMTVLAPGVQTTVQELPGRVGLWHVGVPPSGAWDDLSFALATLAVGNDPTAAGLEAVLVGPALCFSTRTLVCLAGAVHHARLDDRAVPVGVVMVVPAGGVLDLGPVDGPGMRGYLAVQGGIDADRVLGSRATFLLGELGGCAGRALAAGDELRVGNPENARAPLDVAPLLPHLTSTWELRVISGPHGAPDYLTDAGVRELFAADWRVDHRADRTGVRLVGPRPGWARTDGGEAGLHPSNIHDSPYPVGAVMLSGDTPVVVGPDGPSLGGFVVAATVISTDRWKLGQLRPGDGVRLVAVSAEHAEQAARARAQVLTEPRAAVAAVLEADLAGRAGHAESAAVAVLPVLPAELVSLAADGHRPCLTVRRAGDRHLLVEAGPPVLDLSVRVWVHLLAEALRERGLVGLCELVEGVRSLLIEVDPLQLCAHRVAELLAELADAVADPSAVVLDSREVVLPSCSCARTGWRSCWPSSPRRWRTRARWCWTPGRWCCRSAWTIRWRTRR